MLKTVLIITLGFVAISLGLMAWNNHQVRDADELKILQRDAMIIAQQFNDTVDQAAIRYEQALQSGTPLSRINAQQIGVDSLMGLGRARTSNDPRNVEFARIASEMLEAGQRVRLTEDGRLMFVHASTSHSAMIAMTTADKWLPPAQRGQRVILHGAKTVSVGDGAVTRPGAGLLNAGQGHAYDGLFKRSATACVTIGQASFALCLSQQSPLLTIDNGIQLLLYLLLLAAPSLAVFGLYSSLGNSATPPQGSASSVRSETIAQATANGFAGVWSVRPDDNTAFINREAASLLGLHDSGDFPVSYLLDQIAAGHRDHFLAGLDSARAGQPFSVSVGTALSQGETRIEFRGGLDRESHAGATSISGLVLDASDRVPQGEREQSSEARLHKAIDSFPSPFALWDKRKRLIFWNKSFELVFGLNDVLRVGVGHETVMLARSGNIVSERGSTDDSGMTMLGLRSGEWFKIVERRTPAGGLITFGLDVTQDVESEEELTRQKKKLRNAVQELARSEGHNAELARKYNDEKAKAERSADSKSAFLANMSHELRTPLNAINGFSEILVSELYGPLGDQRYTDYARDILTSGQHLLDMINDILDIAKIEAGKMTIDPKPIDLVDPVDAAVRMIRRKAEDKGIQMGLQAEDNLPEVDADHRAIRQMVLNLLSNAIKFTDSGGRIIVAVQRKDDFLRVAVRDSGVGIPKEHLPRLAQPFEQVQETRERNFEGTGLGLALTKSFAEMHGGRFTIASEVGKGTMVSFYLPVSKDLSQSGRNVA